MNRQAVIDGNKTIINTNFYLHLLKCENNNKKTINFLKHLRNTFDENDEMYELLDSAIFILKVGEKDE